MSYVVAEAAYFRGTVRVADGAQFGSACWNLHGLDQVLNSTGFHRTCSFSTLELTHVFSQPRVGGSASSPTLASHAVISAALVPADTVPVTTLVEMYSIPTRQFDSAGTNGEGLVKRMTLSLPSVLSGKLKGNALEDNPQAALMIAIDYQRPISGNFDASFGIVVPLITAAPGLATGFTNPAAPTSN